LAGACRARLLHRARDCATETGKTRDVTPGTAEPGTTGV